MNKKILLCLVCCALGAFLMSGCSSNEEVILELSQIRVENVLPNAEERSEYKSLSDIDELVYQQQIAACEMLIDACRQTNYKDYFEEEEPQDDPKQKMTLKEKKIANLVTQRRHIIYDDIEVAFAVNIYRLLQNVEDCPNMDAYVLKAQKDVSDFYDMYEAYVYGEDPQQALLNILTEYSVKTNVLAFTFLDKNKIEVCEAAKAKIYENSKQTEDLRVYVSENNDIIKSLNSLYGSVPEIYAQSISEDANFLAKKLVLSMESLSHKEKLDLINQIDPTPSPTPSPTPTPSATPTLAPTVTQTPRATQTPRVTATPRPSQSNRVEFNATPQPTVDEPLLFE